jgi:hypothetical protein
MELVPAQRQCLTLFERDYCSSPSMGTADQSNLTESLSGPVDGEDDELTAGQRYAHADVPRGNEVESVGRVALMNDHLIAMVGPPPKPSDQPAPLFRRQRCENRPVHDSTMPLIACLETVPVGPRSENATTWGQEILASVYEMRAILPAYLQPAWGRRSPTTLSNIPGIVGKNAIDTCRRRWEVYRR